MSRIALRACKPTPLKVSGTKTMQEQKQPTHTHANVNARTAAHAHKYMHANLYAQMHACIHTCVHTHAQMCACPTSSSFRSVSTNREVLGKLHPEHISAFPQVCMAKYTHKYFAHTSACACLLGPPATLLLVIKLA